MLFGSTHHQPRHHRDRPCGSRITAGRPSVPRSHNVCGRSGWPLQEPTFCYRGSTANRPRPQRRAVTSRLPGSQPSRSTAISPPASAARGGNKVSLRAVKVIFADLTSHQVQRAHRHFQDEMGQRIIESKSASRAQSNPQAISSTSRPGPSRHRSSLDLRSSTSSLDSHVEGGVSDVSAIALLSATSLPAAGHELVEAPIDIE